MSETIFIVVSVLREHENTQQTSFRLNSAVSSNIVHSPIELTLHTTHDIQTAEGKVPARAGMLLLDA